MRKTNQRQALQPTCEADYEIQLKTAKGQAEYQGLVRLIAQVLDAAGQGEDVSIRFGSTKSRNTYICTLYQDGEPIYATGTTWALLLEACETLL